MNSTFMQSESDKGLDNTSIQEVDQQTKLKENV